MNAVLADAGPLYASVDPHDSLHQRATQELRKLTREKRDIVIALPTLLETYSLLLFRLGTEISLRWLREISEASLVSPTSEDYRRAFARLHSLADQRITLFDAVA